MLRARRKTGGAGAAGERATRTSQPAGRAGAGQLAVAGTIGGRWRRSVLPQLGHPPGGLAAVARIAGVLATNGARPAAAGLCQPCPDQPPTPRRRRPCSSRRGRRRTRRATEALAGIRAATHRAGVTATGRPIKPAGRRSGQRHIVRAHSDLLDDFVGPSVGDGFLGIGRSRGRIIATLSNDWPGGGEDLVQLGAELSFPFWMLMSDTGPTIGR